MNIFYDMNIIYFITLSREYCLEKNFTVFLYILCIE